jgi:hypothetical protein
MNLTLGKLAFLVCLGAASWVVILGVILLAVTWPTQTLAAVIAAAITFVVSIYMD